MINNIKAIYSERLSTKYEARYELIDLDTGEIVDDAQGYGYKTQQKAYAAWGYKNRDKSKDVEKKTKKNKIKAWMKKHKGFVAYMDEVAFEICKGSWGSDDKFDSKLVAEMLKERNLEPDFTATELLKVWKRG